MDAYVEVAAGVVVLDGLGEWLEKGGRKDEGSCTMNWEDRIRKADAGKLNPERAEEIVKEAKEKGAVKPDSTPCSVVEPCPCLTS